MIHTVSRQYAHIEDMIKREECVVLDGAMATELQARGARDFRLSDNDHWGFEALQHLPESIVDVHKSYLEAGCDVITTDTYGILDATGHSGSALRLGSQPLHWMDLARESVRLARRASSELEREDDCAVAFSIGGDVVTDEHLKTVRLLLRCFSDSPPDLVLFETLSMMKDNRTREAIDLILESGLPVWVSFRRCREGVCGIHGQLWGGPEGDYFGRLATDLEAAGVGALLINCLPVQRVSGTLPWLSDFTDLPLGVYPNLGRYVDPQWRFDNETDAEEFSDMALIWRAEGARILGGCCGVRPDHIAAIASAVKDTRPLAPIGATDSPGAAERSRRALPDDGPATSAPWLDEAGRALFPLALPELTCEPDVFVPTQGSYLVWKHLFKEGIGKDKRCLDVGCGAGLLSIQLALNGATHVTAIDVQKAAVANTLTNAFRNNVSDRMSGAVVDLYTVETNKRYDVIVASLYQMPTNPMGELSGHRPIDFWGRNLLDHLIAMLPALLEEDGVAYVMQVSLLSQEQTEARLKDAGLTSRVIDYSLYRFTPVFLENLDQIRRVEEASDAYHFSWQDDHVMVMYLLEVRRAG